MRLVKAQHLFLKIQDVRAVGIGGSRRHIAAVVNGIDRGEGIPLRKVVIHPQGAEILANRLQRAAEILGNPACRIAGLGRRFRPQIQQRLDRGHRAGARSIIRNERERGLVEMLAEAFVISEHKGFIFLDSSA